MIKNSSEYLDVKELVDFVLEYGKDNSLPNMEGSGEAAYQAALRLQQHGLPKAYDGEVNEKECAWQYVSKATFSYSDKKGGECYLDAALWKCTECGEVKIKQKKFRETDYADEER